MTVLLLGFTAACSAKINGNYGAITDFNVSSHEARERILTMASKFGIREWQFYDLVPSYTPTNDSSHPQWQLLFKGDSNACWHGEAWLPKFMQARPKCRSAVDAYMKAVRRLPSIGHDQCRKCLSYYPPNFSLSLSVY